MKLKGLFAFSAVALLILGGLAWATWQSLHVESERLRAAAGAVEAEKLFVARLDRADRLRAAMWRLDSRLSPAISREDSRPFPHYFALHNPFPAINTNGLACTPGQFFLPSPLLSAELPDWILLHFQIDSKGWDSPQNIPESLQQLLRKQPIELALNNVTLERGQLVKQLNAEYPPSTLLNKLSQLGLTPGLEDKSNEKWFEFFGNLNKRVGNTIQTNAIPPLQNDFNTLPAANLNPQQPQIDYASRISIQNRARRDGQGSYYNDDNRDMRANYTFGDFTLGKSGAIFQTVGVQVSSMKPMWLPSVEKPKYLMMVRGAFAGGKPMFQGILVDWERLQEVLVEEVSDLFPQSSLKPLPPGEPPHLDRAMTAIPVEFETGEPEIPETLPEIDESTLAQTGWTPLRLGLVTAWVAALIALLAVGVGGWSLIDFSERRIRFVSAVTHELRTPLTTLRLYLDLLSSGMIQEEATRQEYLQTLNNEADRLHRLIGNVLDFARLEKSKPTIHRQPVAVSQVLERLECNWRERCLAGGKQLVIDNQLDPEQRVVTDSGLVEQILSNLIDNAQKYSRDAQDPRIIVRALSQGTDLVFEVEDRGPGVQKSQQRRIFQPFQRGDDASTTGGVGLGLALATRWAGYLSGKLDIQPGPDQVGARFRLLLPANDV